MKLVKEKGKVLLVDDERIEQLVSSIENANENLEELHSIVKGASYPTDEEFLSGIFKEGGIFILNYEEDRVTKWLKDSPLPQASVTRLIREARQSVPEELVNGINRVLGNITRELNNMPVPTWRSYIEYADSSLCLSSQYRADNEAKCKREVRPSEVADARAFIDILPVLRDLEDKGYNLCDTHGNTGTQLYTIPGLVSIYAGNRYAPEKRKNGKEEDVVLDFLTHSSLTKKEYDARRAEL